MEIISKRHPYKFYLVLILTSAFFLGIGIIFISASIRDKNNVGILISFIFIGLTVYMNWVFTKNSSKIVLNKTGIRFKNTFYHWDNIESITLTGKKGLFMRTPTECATLVFKNAMPILIFDDFYSNTPEMKYFIQEIVVNKKDTIEDKDEKIDLNKLSNELFIPYKGHPIFSFRGILLWGLIIFVSGITVVGGRKLPFEAHLFISGLCVIWFLLHASMMYYFEISKDYFIAKNHYFFWKEHIYPISELKEIVFERQGKQPNSLRLITNKFKTKWFPAGSLTDATWLEMKKELESKNIGVRNECIYET